MITNKKTLRKEIEYLKKINEMLKSKAVDDSITILDLKKDKRILLEELDRVRKKV